MTQDTPSIAAIVEGLSEAQRRQILMCTPMGKIVSTGEPCSFLSYAKEQVADALDRKGLSRKQRSRMGYRVTELTPLGIAVRTALQEHSK